MRIYVGATIEPVLGKTDMYIECPGCKTKMRIVDMYQESLRPMLCGSINAMRLIQFVGNFAMEHSGCPNE